MTEDMHAHDFKSIDSSQKISRNFNLEFLLSVYNFIYFYKSIIPVNSKRYTANITNHSYYTFYMDLIYHHNIILLFCTTHH